jgi:hypothetical protein
MNAPAAAQRIEVQIGDALVTVPGEAAALAYLEQLIDQRRPLPLSLRGSAERLDELRTRAAVRIGETGLYGTYAGIARRDDQGGDHILEVIEVSTKEMTWEEAKKWTEAAGGILPTRKHAALLFANVPELFLERYYWTSEPHAEDGEYAWIQRFGDGRQYCNPQSYEYLAVAVRRVPLQPLTA